MKLQFALFLSAPMYGYICVRQEGRKRREGSAILWIYYPSKFQTSESLCVSIFLSPSFFLGLLCCLKHGNCMCVCVCVFTTVQRKLTPDWTARFVILGLSRLLNFFYTGYDADEITPVLCTMYYVLCTMYYVPVARGVNDCMCLCGRLSPFS